MTHHIKVSICQKIGGQYSYIKYALVHAEMVLSASLCALDAKKTDTGVQQTKLFQMKKTRRAIFWMDCLLVVTQILVR